ncbi:MAG: ribonuclease P protein component [Syntrophomonas sp.]|uniref:ribonuclease P protein component n=1 Tax=Syntrophomonas sp. TaxID=2053627 RepID=UPI00261C2E40|nr:ribonuclease P protein component [Syntrophomonas sp.]MDD2510009.1 ribonuclease P protein component [Syntrophomonas sp.]MDD3880579.1 ribonuclease P protein component [Syntrophomonas sp.]MDD4626114.1 ribonuclease P protein component [Syntrophomonas sp.]
MLDKKTRIRTGKEYRNVFEKGKRFSGRYLIMYYLENAAENNRFGFITNKKVGMAVIRNRIKRQLRAIVRKYPGQVRKNHDIVLVARAGIGKTSFEGIEKDYIFIMKKAGLFAKTANNTN